REVTRRAGDSTARSSGSFGGASSIAVSVLLETARVAAAGEVAVGGADDTSEAPFPPSMETTTRLPSGRTSYLASLPSATNTRPTLDCPSENWEATTPETGPAPG